MRRNVLIILGFAALAWGVLAIVLGSPTLRLESGSGAASRVSPACLPATLEHTARLPGTDVDVSPAPESGTANPDTQISFLGVPAAQIREVSVVGGRSGRHSGRLHGYSQGDGASFAPDTPFDAGERVAVSAADRRGQRRQADRLSLSRRHSISDGDASRSSPTRRRRPPTIRASTPCPASRRRS